MDLYVKAESEDGYMRDACLFREKINIWDTMSSQVRYHNDVLLNYSLNACMFGDTRTYTVRAGGEAHWGGDTRMQDMIFRGPVPDPLGQTAGTRAGALSILIGIATRRSIEQQRPFMIEELVKI